MSVEDFWLSFLYSILATVVGGSVLAFIFFLIKEKLCPPPEVAGLWYMEVKTEKYAFNPFEGMILRYVVLLWREGNRIEGTAEKIYVSAIAGKENLVAEKRTRSIISGVVEKNYFSKDRVLLHAVEAGKRRDSTNFYQLICTTPGNMVGDFWSTAADQSGTVKWQRAQF